MHPLRRMSQIFVLQSRDPDAKNSPNGVEVHRYDVAPVARQRAHHLSLLQVPQLERAPRGARDDHLLGVVERHALHRGLMARERQDRG